MSCRSFPARPGPSSGMPVVSEIAFDRRSFCFRFACAVVSASLSVVAAQPAPAREIRTSTLRPGELFEQHFTAQTSMKNGYVEGLPEDGKPFAVARFTCDDCTPKLKHPMDVPLFWDGPQQWTLRFAPQQPGAWRYSVDSVDPGLRSQHGQLTCAAWSAAEQQQNRLRHGLLRVNHSDPARGHSFMLADGTPFLWVGDTWWDWSRKDIPFTRFQKLVDDREQKGFTVGQLFFNGNGGLVEDEWQRPNLEQIAHVEAMIRYANNHGIVVWIHPWWTNKDLGGKIGAEKTRRWIRYTVHRLGAFNVVWVIAAEYNLDNYGGLSLEFWKSIAKRVRAEDPYPHLLSAHPTPPGWSGGDAAPQWSTADLSGKHPWLDFEQMQSGHGRWRNELIPMVVSRAWQMKPARPIVVTEPWYEFIQGDAAPEDIRFGAWSAFLSGAAGHSYGGGHIWWAQVPESHTDQKPYPLELPLERDTLDYLGARSISFFAKFLQGIEWWRLAPHPDLILDYAHPYCAASEQGEMVAYLRWGGVARVDLSHWKGRKFAVSWFNLTTQKRTDGTELNGGSVGAVNAPEQYLGPKSTEDWLLWVRPAKTK